MSVKKVSVIFICLREYNVFFDRFYESCEKLFLRGVDKNYFVITDHGPEFLGDKENVTYCKVRTPKYEDRKGKRRVDKRRIKLNKFSYIDKFWPQIRQSDYIFYFDADSVIRKTIRQEDVINDEKSIVGVVHGFGTVRNGKGKKGIRFEDEPKSSAYVDPEKYDVSTYYQSCLWGGRPNDVRAMVDDVGQWIEKDLEIGHKNKYNICDEVYVNKYFVLNKNNLHELDGRYSCPSEGIAYRKGVEYLGLKDIIISHECAAQNNTYRKFMEEEKKESQSIIETEFKKINFGCGSGKISGWLNVDIVPRFCDLGKPIDVCAPLPFKSESFEAALSSHLVEHLEYEKSLFDFLKEVNRVLVAGGKFWIITPDMKKACEAYLRDKGKELHEDRMRRNRRYKRKIFNPTLYGKIIDETTPSQHFINDLFHQEGQHKNLLDIELLEWLALKAGFSKAEEVTDEIMLKNIPEKRSRKDSLQAMYAVLTK